MEENSLKSEKRDFSEKFLFQFLFSVILFSSSFYTLLYSSNIFRDFLLKYNKISKFSFKKSSVSVKQFLNPYVIKCKVNHFSKEKKNKFDIKVKKKISERRKLCSFSIDFPKCIQPHALPTKFSRQQKTIPYQNSIIVVIIPVNTRKTMPHFFHKYSMEI